VKVVGDVKPVRVGRGVLIVVLEFVVCVGEGVNWVGVLLDETFKKTVQLKHLSVKVVLKNKKAKTCDIFGHILVG